LLVLGFLAGFSERWAQDTLTSVLPGSKSTTAPAPVTPPAPVPAATTPSSDTHPEGSTS
jgi:hypothetical protein